MTGLREKPLIPMQYLLKFLKAQNCTHVCLWKLHKTNLLLKSLDHQTTANCDRVKQQGYSKSSFTC